MYKASVLRNTPSAPDAVDPEYGSCRVCGELIPPGGVRSIGVCVDCVSRQSVTAPVRVPSPMYRFSRGNRGDR